MRSIKNPFDHLSIRSVPAAVAVLLANVITVSNTAGSAGTERCFQRLVCLPGVNESVTRPSSFLYCLLADAGCCCCYPQPFNRRMTVIRADLRPTTLAKLTTADWRERLSTASIRVRRSPVTCTADCWLRRPRRPPGHLQLVGGANCQSTLGYS